MKRWIVAVAAAAVMTAGCATSGPGYLGPAYVADAGDVALRATWYPNTFLDGAASFHSASSDGALVLRGRRLIFAVDSAEAGRKVVAWQASADAVTYVTAKKHGLSRIVRLQADGAMQSFLFGSTASDGSEKDQFVDRTLALFPR